MDVAPRGIDRWRRSIVFKVFAVSFLCIHLPLLTVLAALAFSSPGWHTSLVLVVLGATLAGTIACLSFMWWMIRPLIRLSDAITRYRISGDFQEAGLDKRADNEIGVATRAVCGMVGEITSLGERLQGKPATDPLTGLLNSSAVYDDRFDEVLGYERQSDPASLVMFEINHFHDLRRKAGREVTDRLLVDVGDVVRRTMGPEHIAARMSGATFLLVVPGASAKEVKAFCDRLRLGLTEVSAGPLQRGEVAATFGISRRAEKTPVAEAIHRADMALYQAKDTGRSVAEA